MKITMKLREALILAAKQLADSTYGDMEKSYGIDVEMLQSAYLEDDVHLYIEQGRTGRADS